MFGAAFLRFGDGVWYGFLMGFNVQDYSTCCFRSDFEDEVAGCSLAFRYAATCQWEVDWLEISCFMEGIGQRLEARAEAFEVDCDADLQALLRPYGAKHLYDIPSDERYSYILDRRAREALYLAERTDFINKSLSRLLRDYAFTPEEFLCLTAFVRVGDRDVFEAIQARAFVFEVRDVMKAPSYGAFLSSSGPPLSPSGFMM